MVYRRKKEGIEKEVRRFVRSLKCLLYKERNIYNMDNVILK